MRSHIKLIVAAVAATATVVGTFVALTTVGIGSSGPTRTYPSSTCPQADGPAGGLEQCIATSAPGTTIVVKRGVYYENDIDVDRKITILGPCENDDGYKPAVIDAAPPRPPAPGVKGVGFDVAADNVTLSCLTIRHATQAVDADQVALVNNLRIDRVRTLDAGDFSNPAIDVRGNAFRIQFSNLSGGNDDGIEADGNDGRVLSNRARNYGNHCFDLGGNTMLVEGNTATNCEDGRGFDVAGDNNAIRKNTGRLADAGCFGVSGDGNEVKENRAENCDDDGFLVQGAGNRVVLNVVTGGFPSRAFEINGANPVVEHNKAAGGFGQDVFQVVCTGSACDQGRVVGNSATGSNSNDSGFEILVFPAPPCSTFPCFRVTGNTASMNNEEGFFLVMEHSLISGNTATLNGAEDDEGLFVDGQSNVIEANVVKENAYDGLAVSGSDNTIRKNLASENGVDGIHLRSGTTNTLSQNVATNNAGDGIENDGAATTITGNVSRGNRADCVGDLPPAASSGNSCADGSNFVGDPGTIDESP